MFDLITHWGKDREIELNRIALKQVFLQEINFRHEN
jgi:hypothetical protein